MDEGNNVFWLPTWLPQKTALCKAPFYKAFRDILRVQVPSTALNSLKTLLDKDFRAIFYVRTMENDVR